MDYNIIGHMAEDENYDESAMDKKLEELKIILMHLSL